MSERKALADATAKELADFANSKLDLGRKLDPKRGKAFLLEAIKEVYEDDNFPLDEAVVDGVIDFDADFEAEPETPAAPVPQKGDKWAVIHIDVQEGPGGDAPVYVDVDFRPMLIPRGEDVHVRYKYVDALRSATMKKYTSRRPKNGEVGMFMTEREVQRYPHQVIKTYYK